MTRLTSRLARPQWAPRRSFAEAAAEPKVYPRGYAPDEDNVYRPDIEVPTHITGKAGEAAMAIYCYAMEKGGDKRAESLEKELVVLSWDLKEDDSWSVATQSPFFDDETRATFVTEFVKDTGASDFAANVVNQLVIDGLVEMLPQIATDYEEIMRGHRKEVDIVFTTASPLSSSQVDYFKSTIKTDFLTPEDKPIFVHNVDPTLGGGYKVSVKGITSDYSWAGDISSTQRALDSVREIAANNVRNLKSQLGITADQSAEEAEQLQQNRTNEYKKVGVYPADLIESLVAQNVFEF